MPEAVVPQEGLVRAGRFLWIAAGILVLVFVLNFSRAKILFARFWAPGADITLTQVHAGSGDMIIGKGRAVTLEFTTTGERRDDATLFLRSSNGRNETIPLKRAASASSFAYTKSSVVDAFEYRTRSGDGQTPWHRVTLAERPNLTQIKMKITPPAYSHLPIVEMQNLPPRVRALARQSILKRNFRPISPLTSRNTDYADNSLCHWSRRRDNLYRFEALLTNVYVHTLLTVLSHL